MTGHRLTREATGMTAPEAPYDDNVPAPAPLRFVALVAPLLLLGYGVLRLIDGLDGTYGPDGVAWTVGHVLFGLAFVGLAVMIAQLRGLAPAAVGSGSRRLADAAAVTALAGVACFLWVTAGDLSGWLRATFPLPHPLYAVAPPLYLAGLLTLLVRLTVADRHRLPLWSPVLVLLSHIVIIMDLDLMPAAAALLLVGLAPLTWATPAPVDPATGPAGQVPGPAGHTPEPTGQATGP